MQQMYKVIIVDNLNRDYKPQGLVTMAMAESSATRITELINTYSSGYENCAIVVPAEQPLNISSQYDLVGEVMPYDQWIMLTGAAALPDHVAQYWYNTTVLKQPELVAEFNGTIVHHYDQGNDLIVLPDGRSSGPHMWPYGTDLKITITKE